MGLDIDLGKSLANIGETIVEAQEKFVESNLYGIFNSALDTGIRIALPEVAEDVVIDVKDTLMENGFRDGVKQIWNNIKEFGKSAYGLITGKFESVEQIQNATKEGGVLDVVSGIFDFALNKAVDNEKISKSTRQNVKNAKNSVVRSIKNQVSDSLDKQIGYVEKIEEYNEKWQDCFDKQDLSGMKKANKNIQKYLNKTIPLENVLKNARRIEIMQNLVESTGSFDITEEERELVNSLSVY